MSEIPAPGNYKNEFLLFSSFFATQPSRELYLF